MRRKVSPATQSAVFNWIIKTAVPSILHEIRTQAVRNVASAIVSSEQTHHIPNVGDGYGFHQRKKARGKRLNKKPNTCGASVRNTVLRSRREGKLPPSEHVINITYWLLMERNECRTNILQRVNTRIPAQGMLDFPAPREAKRRKLGSGGCH